MTAPRHNLSELRHLHATYASPPRGYSEGINAIVDALPALLAVVETVQTHSASGQCPCSALCERGSHHTTCPLAAFEEG